jgi:site-specific recombinase XerD
LIGQIKSKQEGYKMSEQTLTKVSLSTDWQGDFERALQLKGRSSNTIDSYLRAISDFTGWFSAQNGQAFGPELLNAWDLRTYRTWCLEIKRIAPATWNQRRSALQTFCDFCRKMGWIGYDPMEDIALVESDAEQPRWLDKAEFGRLMRQIEIEVNGANTETRKWRAIRDAAIVGVMAHAGLRDSEAMALRLADVQLTDRKGVIQVNLAKGEKYRRVPVNTDLRKLLNAWLEVRKEGEFLFSDENGSPLATRAAIEKRITALGEAAKIEALTPHRLRHTFAKRMVDSGTPLNVVQKLLGHARLETTQRYVQAGWEDMEEAVQGISMGKLKRGGK